MNQKMNPNLNNQKMNKNKNFIYINIILFYIYLFYMTTIDLSKTNINLDILGSDNELMIANYQTSRAVILNPSQYDISLLSCELNLKIPQIWINKNSDLYKNICVGFCGGMDSNKNKYYKNVQTTNVQKIMYALRDKTFDYIHPDVFCISNENFFKSLNISFNIIMDQANTLNNQTANQNIKFEYYRFATIPPYFEYININEIIFHRMLITPPVAINGGVGWFYSYELAKIFETLFGNYDIQSISDYDGTILGYINITDRFDISQFPDDTTASYVVDSKTLNNTLAMATPMRHDIFPEGGGPPYFNTDFTESNNINKSSIGYWCYTKAAKYSYNNTYQNTSVRDNFACWGFPFPDPDSLNGVTKNNTYSNTFVKTISLESNPFSGVNLKYNMYPTDACDSLLNTIKYENDFVNLNNGEVIINNGEISFNNTIQYYSFKLLSILNYIDLLTVATTTNIFPVMERLTITSVCTLSQLLNPILNVDILAYGLTIREELVLNNTKTDTSHMVLRPVLKSYILDPDTIESSDYSLTDFPNGEILRIDMLGVNPINQFTIQLFAYSDDGIYVPLKSFGVTSSIKLMFTKKKI